MLKQLFIYDRDAPYWICVPYNTPDTFNPYNNCSSQAYKNLIFKYSCKYNNNTFYQFVIICIFNSDSAIKMFTFDDFRDDFEDFARLLERLVR